MSKYWFAALALMVSAMLWAAPAMAQSDNLDSIQRGGAEGAADSTLGTKGLVWSTDGFSLRLSTYVQFRFTYQNEVAGGRGGTNGRDFLNFRIRRAKTTFEGYIFQKEFQYKLQLAWSTPATLIENAWFRWAAMQYFNVTVGQSKLEWNWEELASAKSMQFVDRSYVNSVFNQSYAKGITLDGQIGQETAWLKYWFGVYNGVLRANDDFRNSDFANPTAETFSNLIDNEMMINLRLETHPLGEVKRTMYDARGEDEYSQVLFAFGLGVNWFTSGYLAQGTGGAGIRGDVNSLGNPNPPTASGRPRTSQDTWAFTIDGHFRWHGLSADLAYYWRHTDFHNRGANRFDPTSQASVANLTDSGFSLEIAYMILPDMFNVGIRFNILNAEDFWQGGSGAAGNPREFGLRPDATELGISANWFIHGDNLKLTFDVLMVGQQVTSEPGTTANPLNGVYNNPPSRDFGGGTIGSSEADHNDLWIVRLQLQWMF